MTARVDRTRLLTVLAQTPGLWIVEACGGSGKSELAQQIVTKFGGALYAHMPFESDHGDATLVVDIAAGIWDPGPDEVAALLARPDGALTVVCARFVANAGRTAAASAGARWLRAADLWFDADELEQLAHAESSAGNREPLGSLAALTDGWPAAVEACLVEIRRADGDMGGVASAAFSEVFDAPVSALSKEDSAGLDLMSYFDRFDPEMARLIGRPALLETLVLSGVPVLTDGRWSWLRPVARSRVRRRIAGVPQTGRDVFDRLADRGHVLEAIEAAIELNQPNLAAEILAALDIDGAGSLDAARMDAVWARLGSTSADWPRSHLVRARQVLSTGNISATIDQLREALSTTHALDSRDHQELTAELAFALYLSGELDEARSLLGEMKFTDQRSRARALEVEAGLAALTRERKALQDATDGFIEAERLWANSGSMGQAAVTLGRLALEVTMRTGHLTQALELMDKVLVTSASNPARRASTQLVRSRMLALSGRDDEAAALLHEVDGLIGTVLRTWMAAHAHQARAHIASHTHDAEEVVRLLGLAEAALGDLANHAPGAAFHLDAVETCARCGLGDKALDHLQVLRSHTGAEPPDVALGEIIVECRIGDPTTGLELIASFRSTDIMPPGGDWKLAFLESLALDRLGRQDEAGAARASAERLAALVGTPGIIEATESAMPETATAHLVCCLFPDFAVRRGADKVEVPPGQPRTVLKVLVLNGGGLALDELIEVLWPEVDPVVGRRRLRNVLSRVRAACGEVLVREGEVLSLAAAVRSDYAKWWDASVDALDATTTDEAALRALLAEAPNVLLPSDRYEEWLQPHQRRYQLQLLRLCDLHAGIAAAADHVDAAVGAYLRGHEIDPWDDERLEQAISLLRANGRTSAIAALERLRPEDRT